MKLLVLNCGSGGYIESVSCLLSIMKKENASVCVCVCDSKVILIEDL